MRAVYNTPHEAFPLLCSWQLCSNCQILTASKPKRTVTPYTVYMSAQPLPIGAFGMGIDITNGKTFTLKTALFGWQSMILRSGLTLSNINMSKESTLSWFFLLNSLYYQWLFVSLHRQFPPSLSTMLKCVGLFFVYILLLSKYANGKITALHETLYDRGRLDGSVEKSWACYFRWRQSGTVFGEHRVLSSFRLYVPILESSKGNSSV